MRPARLFLVGFPLALICGSAVLIHDYCCKARIRSDIGHAMVVDGDSLKVDGVRWRLHGIDAPELHQTCTYPTGAPWPCGEAARGALLELIGNDAVVCTEVEKDRHLRSVGSCSVRGRDIGAEMVRSGFAVAYRRYSTRYVPQEIEAKAQKRGIWNGEFVEPEKWRRSKGR